MSLLANYTNFHQKTALILVILFKQIVSPIMPIYSVFRVDVADDQSQVQPLIHIIEFNILLTFLLCSTDWEFLIQQPRRNQGKSIDERTMANIGTEFGKIRNIYTKIVTTGMAYAGRSSYGWGIRPRWATPTANRPLRSRLPHQGHPPKASPPNFDVLGGLFDLMHRLWPQKHTVKDATWIP